MTTILTLPGWKLLGAFPDGEEDDVGSWLLHDRGEAMLLEIPPGFEVNQVRDALWETNSQLRYVTASHLHEDHFDRDIWRELQKTFPEAEFIRPAAINESFEKSYQLGHEIVWRLGAPKHSPSDVVTVFRGRAMTGDIELGILDSVNREVSRTRKMASMEFLKGFQKRTGYRVHTTVSAHLNDFRENVSWVTLFDV